MALLRFPWASGVLGGSGTYDPDKPLFEPPVDAKYTLRVVHHTLRSRWNSPEPLPASRGTEFDEEMFLCKGAARSEEYYSFLFRQWANLGWGSVVTTEVGGGSCFQFQFPEETAAAPPPHTPIPTRVRGNTCFLDIDMALGEEARSVHNVLNRLPGTIGITCFHLLGDLGLEHTIRGGMVLQESFVTLVREFRGRVSLSGQRLYLSAGAWV